MVGEEILRSKKGHVTIVSEIEYDEIYDKEVEASQGRYIYPELNLPDKLDDYLSMHAYREDVTTGSLMVYILNKATVEDKKYNFSTLPRSNEVYRRISVPETLYDKIKAIADSQNTSWN